MAVAGDNIKSNPIINLDSQPIVFPTTGEGATGNLKALTDWVATTAAAVATSAWRLARFPTNAKVKDVWLWTSNLGATAGATLDVNVAFSDSLTDGTQPALVGTIPTTANNGTVTTPTAYASPNKLFGTALATGAANAELGPNNITFSGPYTPANREDNMWDVFGFVDAFSRPMDPGGRFDIYIVAAAGGTGAVTPGIISVEIDFIV